MTKRLSEILTIRSDFNFFKSIKNLDPFVFENLVIVIDDLITYTLQAEKIFETLETEYKDRMELDYDWVNEGYENFYTVYRNIDSIDSIVIQALNLLENNMEKEEGIGETDIFDKLENLNEKSMFIKRHHLIPIKIKVDLTIEYNEIYNLTMNSINKELENCLKRCFKIHEKRFSSPVRHAPSFNLDILTKKLLQQKDRLRLPILNGIDNELYDEYLTLKSNIDPIEASLKYIPSRIQEFEKNYGNILQAENLDKLGEKYSDLVKEFNYLNNEVKDLKYDLVDSRWNEIFSYLNTEISFLIESVEKEIGKISRFDDRPGTFKEQIIKRVKYVTNIVENTFTIINQAIDEDLIDFKVVEKSNELANKWLTVKGTMPDEIIDQIYNENTDDNETNNDKKDNDVVYNFKKLSLENKAEENNSENPEIAVKSPLKDQRRSRAGQFFMGKMNLVPVLIENDPTSVKKPEDVKVLTNSSKINQISFNFQQKQSLADSLKNIPDLKKTENDILTTKFNSSETTSTSPQVHIDTLSQLLGGTSDIPELQDDEDDLPDFETPLPKFKRNATSSSATISSNGTGTSKESRLRQPIDYKLQSRIPRPISRLGTISDRSSSKSGSSIRSTSSLGIRTSLRPATSLSFSRSSIESTPMGNYRHSFHPGLSPIQQTPIRSSRKSFLQPPTPVQEILERSSSRLSESRLSGKFEPLSTTSSSNSRSHSRSSSRGSSQRPGSSAGSRTTKPIWR